MKRILPCLAALVIGLLTPTANARSNDPVDPIADLIQTSLEQATARTPSAADRAFRALRDLAPDWTLKATLYHSGAKGVGGRDSLGCPTVAMRTAATDRTLVPRRTVLYIKETVGMPMPDGAIHDGYWYASDVGGAVKGNRIDLFTGHSRASMNPMMKLNMKTVTVSRVGTFEGCPKPVVQVAMR
ncbi:MAG: 3D domain-containing protein [Caulobacter sp.]|nr:3D domain-containing protein [Caulobacter sp.]